MIKIGIIHTTPATVASLRTLVEKEIPEAEVIDILDDSILKDMSGRNDVPFVRERWMTYARILERLGVRAVLSACSTVGEFAEEADGKLGVPVCRIDEAMAEKAVSEGREIAVLATLDSTLGPTVRLVERKAREIGKEVRIQTVLVEGAYEALKQGKKEVHDRKIRDAAAACLEKADRVVLAQASMASAVSGLEGAREKVLTSPELGIRKLKRDLERL